LNPPRDLQLLFEHLFFDIVAEQPDVVEGNTNLIGDSGQLGELVRAVPQPVCFLAKRDERDTFFLSHNWNEYLIPTNKLQ